MQPPSGAAPEHSGALSELQLRKHLCFEDENQQKTSPCCLRPLIASLDQCFPGMISSPQQKRKTNNRTRSHLPDRRRTGDTPSPLPQAAPAPQVRQTGFRALGWACCHGATPIRRSALKAAGRSLCLKDWRSVLCKLASFKAERKGWQGPYPCL